jgi:hypothetical protein
LRRRRAAGRACTSLSKRCVAEADALLICRALVTAPIWRSLHQLHFSPYGSWGRDAISRPGHSPLYLPGTKADTPVPGSVCAQRPACAPACAAVVATTGLDVFRRTRSRRNGTAPGRSEEGRRGNPAGLRKPRNPHPEPRPPGGPQEAPGRDLRSLVLPEPATRAAAGLLAGTRPRTVGQDRPEGPGGTPSTS